MFGMNSDQVMQLWTIVAGLVGGVLVNDKVLSSDQWTTLSGAIVSLAGAAAAIWAVVYPIWKQAHKQQLATGNKAMARERAKAGK